MRYLDKTQLRYPGLWKNCVGAWDPLLGPTGSTLRDQSRRGNNGTFNALSPSTSWNIVGGHYGVRFAGAGAYIALPDASMVVGTTSRTYSFWAVTDASAVAQTMFNSGPDTSGARVTCTLQQTVIAIAVSGHNYGATISTSSALNHYAVTLPENATSGSFVFYVNGILQAAATITGSAQTVNTGATLHRIGAKYDSTAWNGSLVHMMVHNRQLATSEIKLLSSRPGITSERLPRRRYMASAAAGNRRRRVLLTGVG